jgi:hypothetical protein
MAEPSVRDRLARYGELLAECAGDPVLFAELFLPKKPHPGQAEWLRNSRQAVNVLVPGNRWGKSTVIAMKHIWKCVFKVGMGLRELAMRQPYETISIAMSHDQAEIVFAEAKRMLSAKGLRVLVKAFRSTPFPHVIFANGSVMHCRSAHDDGKYIDGHRYYYISVDEAGWITDLRRLMSQVILLRLAGGGEVDLVGTPKGFNDLYFYYERGLRGVPGYYAQRGSIYDNPYLPEEDIRMRDRLLEAADPRFRAQALHGEFVDFEGLAFTRDQRDNAFRPELPMEEGPQPGRRYVAAWDLGRTEDFTVGVVLDVTERPWRLVCYRRLNKVPWEEIYATIGDIARLYGVRWTYVDASGPGGDVVEEELEKRGISVVGVKISSRERKVELINRLQNAFDEGRRRVGWREREDEAGRVVREPVMEAPREGNWGLLRLPVIPELMDEVGIYRLSDKDIPFTDSVMALGLAVQAAYDAEGVAPPLLGGWYWSPTGEQVMLETLRAGDEPAVVEWRS